MSDETAEDWAKREANEGPVPDEEQATPPEPGEGPSTEAPRHLVKQSSAAWHFARIAGHLVRYDHARERWLIWGRHRWHEDKDGAVDRLWLAILAQRYADAVDADPEDRARIISAIHTAGGTNAAIRAGLSIASTMEPITTTGEEWDTDPYLLGCENGTVDLRTGERHDGVPEEMISLSTGIDFNPDAQCPRWDTFFTEVFGGDEELAFWMDLALGASLIGKSKELLVLNWGESSNNGKTKFAEIVRNTLGDYANIMGITSFTNANRKAGAATPDLLVLRTARLLFTSEPDKAAKLNGGTLKRMVSDDLMPLRANYGDEERIKPGHTFFLQTNHLPTIDDAGEGFWRRIALVPWTTHFRKPGEPGDGPEQDANLLDKLLAEREGILAKMVRHAVLYLRSQSTDDDVRATGRDLWPMPKAVQAETMTYREQEDRLLPFITSRLVIGKTRSVAVGRVRTEYKAWCEAEDIPLHERSGPKMLTRELAARGSGIHVVKDTSRNTYLLAGVGLASDPEPRNDDTPSEPSGGPADGQSAGATGPSDPTENTSTIPNRNRGFVLKPKNAPLPPGLNTDHPQNPAPVDPWWESSVDDEAVEEG